MPRDVNRLLRDVKKKRNAQFAKQEKEKAKERRLAEQAAAEEENAGDAGANEPAVDLAKTTQLVFFRQYNTYQALLEVHPVGDFSVESVYAKVILYIMRWFRNRLGGRDACADYPETHFLWEQYPEPEEYEKFDLAEVSNISGFDFIEFETAFLKEKKAWVVRLVEPDNGKERTDMKARTFTTEISVYRTEKSAVLGIRESCREPEKNTVDAIGLRPGFVRDLFYDKDLRITEEGLEPEFAFDHAAYRLNGKSAEACQKLYDGLIAAGGRQMPVLFVPGDFYEKNAEEVDHKTASLLGYCHVVVIESGCRKLFEQIMENPEFVDVYEEGQLIFYRTNSRQEYTSAYFGDEAEDEADEADAVAEEAAAEEAVEDADAESLLDTVKGVAQAEPLRKYFDFKDYAFKPSWWEVPAGDAAEENTDIEELRDRYENQIAQLKQKAGDLERDNDRLQGDLNALKKENREYEKESRKNAKAFVTFQIKEAAQTAELTEVKADNQRLAEALRCEERIRNAMNTEMKEHFRPLLNLPAMQKEKKQETLDWIREYYSDVLVIHPYAEKSFMKDDRNIDRRRFCMMIHYIAGYTKYRNEGGIALDPAAAREYDVEDSAYTVEPSSSGQGSADYYKDKYTITIEEAGETKKVLLDLHVKYGKGMDDNMLRIYFYYSPKEKKTFLGYMPGHLPII